MSNIEASEENVKSPSTYGNDTYQEFRKKEKKKDKTDSQEAKTLV
ncbi:MAG: hypothetical protein WBP88_01435 [Nitrososphaeraceae archaeon]